jgi:Septum formation
MQRALPMLIGGLLVAALAIGLGVWFGRPDPVSTQTPAGAPGVDSCWQVDQAASQGAHPWPAQPVDCAGLHTVDVFSVGQVDTDLVKQARDAEGDARRLAEGLMFGQARQACSKAARDFLGGDWHAGQVDVLANWIKPDRSGFFACAAVQTADPAATTFVERRGRLSLALARGGGPIGVQCVSKASGRLRYGGCATPHDGEFVGTYTVTPPEAPFDEAGVRNAVTKGCGALAAHFLGLPEGGTRAGLRAAYVGPTSAAAWLGSDQAFACYVMADQPVRGSLRGLGRRPLPR